MSADARSRANQHLYFAALHMQFLRAELERELHPASVLLESLGQSIQFHLQRAYGWFLLELTGTTLPVVAPPVNVAQAVTYLDGEEPLRGELVELRNLEAADGWLADLLAVQESARPTAGMQLGIQMVSSPWTIEGLEHWHSSLSDLMDRMSDSLEEC